MTWTTHLSGTSAGGYTNCVAFDPKLQNHLIVGGDTNAFWGESFDGGLTWRPANHGLWDGATGICGIVYDPLQPSAVYAGIGSGGFNHPIAVGTVLTSGGIQYTHWTQQPVNIGQFFGGGNPSWLPAGDTRPRATGHVLEPNWLGSVRYLYAQPYANGVWRSTDDYATVGNSIRIAPPSALGQQLQGIVVDKTNGTRMLVASWGYNTSTPGSYLLGNIRAAATDAATVHNITAGPSTVLEWKFIYDPTGAGQWRLFAACGWFGVYEVTGATWDTWTQLSGLPLGTPGVAGQPIYCGLDGVWDTVNNKLALYVSSCNPHKIDASHNSCVYRYTLAAGWEDITGATSNITKNVWGSGEVWWELNTFSSFALGKGTGDMDNIAMDPFDNTRIHVVGRAGGWQTRNGGVTTAKAGVNWQPSVNGQSGITTTMLVCDPVRTNHIYIADTDYTIIGTSNDFLPGFTFGIKPAGADSKGTYLDMGPDGLLYAGTGAAKTNANGEIYRYDGDPIMAGTTSMGLKAAAGGGEPKGVLVIGTAGTPIILAFVWQGGVWRKVGGGGWTQILTSPQFGSTASGNTIFSTSKDKDTNAAYAVYPATGLFRTLDQGAHFGNNADTTNGLPWWARTDIISVGNDPSTNGRLYVCKKDGIYYVPAANISGTNPTTAAVRITPSTGPMTALAGMAVDQIHGYVYAASLPTSTDTGHLYECQNPTAGSPTFTQVDDIYFQAGSYSLNWLAVDNPGGQIFAMPGGVLEIDNGSFQAVGVGPLVGVSGFRL